MRGRGCHVYYGLFSPDAVATFGLEPEAAAHMLLPSKLLARIDPPSCFRPSRTPGSAESRARRGPARPTPAPRVNVDARDLSRSGGTVAR